MLLEFLGIGQNLTTIGFIWYNLNVLAIAGIIYLVLKLAIVRAENLGTRNSIENKIKQDNLYIKFVIFSASFGIVYFSLRESVPDLKELWSDAIIFIKDLL